MITELRNYLNCSLLVILAGCSPFEGSKVQIAVEETHQMEAGIALEPVQARVLPMSLDRQFYPADSITSRIRSSTETQFFFVDQEQIRQSLMKKIEPQFPRLFELYMSAISNQKSLDLIPELGMTYQFELRYESKSESKNDTVSFRLRDAISGNGVLIRKNKSGVSAHWGPSIIQSQEQGAAQSPRAQTVDLFSAAQGYKLYQLGLDSWLGMKEEGGAKLFLLQLSDQTFRLHSIVTSLPSIGSASEVISTRISPNHVRVLGSTQVQLNGVLVYYLDSDRVMKKIYALDSQFMFQDLTSGCGRLQMNGLLPSEMSCTHRITVEPIPGTANAAF